MADAPGWPGIPPRWTSSDKSGVGTALSPLSRVWFSLSHGILNEIYYPRVDYACTRDFGFLVTDGQSFFAEEKRDTRQDVAVAEDGVPSYALRNTHLGGRFRILKDIITDPRRDVVLQRLRLETLAGGPLSVYGLLAPHLVNGGGNNTAWLGDYKGEEMLFAEGSGTALALACSCPWGARSVGFTGVSDGWQDLHRHFRMEWQYDRAADGNVALSAELRLPEDGECVVALGFGRTAAEAAYRCRASLQQPFDVLAEEYAAAWRAWQATLRPLDRVTRNAEGRGHNTYRISTAVLRSHDSPSFPGGLIASLSIPWGATRGDDDLGGYHLVWPRDLVETAGALLACGAAAEARRVLDYLRTIQEPEGNWPQNCWLDGTPYWRGMQMDETAFPVLLVDLAWRCGRLKRPELARFWPMVRAACGFLLRHGPVTGQDRWEENEGYSVFTLAVEIAALLAAADLADLHAEPATAALLRDTADAWNAAIESWTYVRAGRLAEAAGAAGYFVRIAPPEPGTARARLEGTVTIRNRADGAGDYPVDAIISPDALALVRFGLRAPDDPRILDTLKVVDHLLKVELPQGPFWHRYTADGYGEHTDGRPFDGTGHGRLWPLLTGERAHYAIAAGDLAEAARLLAALEASTSSGGMIPEQIWDTADIPERELFRGRPSGSAMPLVWAHAEHIKLLRSLSDGTVFDMPPQTVRRYLRAHTPARVQPWRPDWQPATLPAGRALRVELPGPATVHWTEDAWTTTRETPTTDTGLGLHIAELSTADLPGGGRLVFTWRWRDGTWTGEDHHLEVIA
jgi:glucoamylase